MLNRALAEQGHYPAIDIEQSISRVMPQVVDEAHLTTAQMFKQLYAKYEQNKDLINIGAYQKGSDPQLDQAILMMPQLTSFYNKVLAKRSHLMNRYSNLLML